MGHRLVTENPRFPAMTAKEIRAVLRKNRIEGGWPASMQQIADDRGCSKSLIVKAVTRPYRYPSARRYVEMVLGRRGPDAFPARRRIYA
jgi:hypothetical protein